MTMLLRNNTGLACLMAIGGLSSLLTMANAADLDRMQVKTLAAQPAATSGWAFYLTPYVWATSIRGTSTVRGRTLDVDVAFLDIIKDAQIPKGLFALMGSVEARNGPWSLTADMIYMRMATSASGVRVRSVLPQVGGALAASASASLEMFIGEFAAGYEVARIGPAAGMPGSATAIDLYGGGRLWWQQAEASLAVAVGVTIADLVVSGGRAVASTGTISWVDPIVGARLRHQFSPGREFVIKGDVGGFGAGSRFSWQAMGAFDWRFAKTQHATWSALIGYRALYADYSQGDGATLYRYDLLMHGPVFGVTAQF